MEGWWPAYGEPGAIAGVLLGVVWGWISTARRRGGFARAGLEPTGQWLWFLASSVSMGSYLALVTAVALMALDERLPSEAMWFLLGCAGLAFCTALLFPRFPAPLAEEAHPPIRMQPKPEPRKPAEAPAEPERGRGAIGS